MSNAAFKAQQAGGGAADKYHGIEFASVEPVLQLYCKALTGKEVDISAGEAALTSLRNAWWGQLASGNPPDGHVSVVVPAAFMEYPGYDDNFGWYKSAVTQQVAHVEFGSFDFIFEKESTLFENLRYQLRGEEGHGHNSFEKYLALFNDRLLAALVFVAVENARIN